MTVLMRFFANRSSCSVPRASPGGLGGTMGPVGAADSEDRSGTGAGCEAAADTVSEAIRSGGRRVFFCPALDALDFFLAIDSLTNRKTLPRAGHGILEAPHQAVRQQRLYRKMSEKSCPRYSIDRNTCHCSEQTSRRGAVSPRMRHRIEIDTRPGETGGQPAGMCVVHSSTLGRRRYGP